MQLSAGRHASSWAKNIFELVVNNLTFQRELTASSFDNMCADVNNQPNDLGEEPGRELVFQRT